jgi:hypothetical protein
MPPVAAFGGEAATRSQVGDTTRMAVTSVSHIKHATIGSLIASLLGGAGGLLLWAKQFDYRGPNRGTMRMIGWMGLGLVTVSVAVACLSIAFLQYLIARAKATAPRERTTRRRLVSTDA